MKPLQTGFQCSWCLGEEVVQTPGWSILQYRLRQAELPGTGSWAQPEGDPCYAERDFVKQ